MSAKKAKAVLKKILTFCVVILVAGILVFAVVQGIMREASSQVFTDGKQTVTLFADGKYTAELLLYMQRSGTYELRENTAVTTIWFYVGDEIAVGWLKDDILQLPVSWEIDDNETFLPKR
ncbi:MAG: hypothetical protein FWD48_03510 [Oscillospiraceae bacterium]|nr:hypothetical protein [Oscillospiraceae bacterium]